LLAELVVDRELVLERLVQALAAGQVTTHQHVVKGTVEIVVTGLLVAEKRLLGEFALAAVPDIAVAAVQRMQGLHPGKDSENRHARSRQPVAVAGNQCRHAAALQAALHQPVRQRAVSAPIRRRFRRFAFDHGNSR